MRNGGSSGSSIPRAVRLIAIVTIAGLCLAATIAGPAAGAAQESRDGNSSTVVSLQPDGDAEVALTIRFDLETDAEREAFQSIRENETKRDELRTEYGDRMAAVAAGTSNATGREMGVGDPSVAFETANGGDTGLIVLSVTWSNLAAVEDGSLRVTDPFADGYEGDVTVVAPEGYELASTSPAPDKSTDRRATWSADSSLEGFEVVAEEETKADSEAESSDGLPGFGVPATVAALVSGLAAVGYRRHAA